ncbi:hypothetical protein [Haloarcula onubensis]|uniref:Uncharacterized protein n=1 Tax=Haloarcula onubensis TaxID=2950539 RepID=A0ABU2FLH6_9EURY|nr:hypothetical protein [Halomicroarcula sp. S3CR25-11]MDS0281585.1 hypothetical protein [Halomicroarcula sp. S3CR25-11]
MVATGTDDRWLAAGGFALALACTLVLATTPAASGYEPSIYGAYPWYFWALGGLALLVGNVVVVRSARRGTTDWLYGLALVLTVVGLLVFLPYFRGYTLFGRADVLSHVGFIRDIQTTGQVSPGNIYPNFHLLVLSLAYATGIAPQTTLMSLAGIGSLFSILSFVALVGAVFDRRRALLSVPFATVLVAVQSVPYVFSILLVPFVLYLFVMERRTRALHVRAAFGLALFALVIYHPITVLFLVLVLCVYGVARLLHARGVLDSTEGLTGPVGPMPFSQLVVAVFAVWYLDFPKIVARFRIVIETLTAPGGGGSSAASYTETVAQYSPTVVDIVRIAALRYGESAILLTLGGCYALAVLVATLRSRTSGTVFRTTFVGGLGLFTGMSVLFFLVDLIVGFGRPLVYAELFAALLAGAFVYLAAERTGARSTVYGLTYVTVAVLLAISTMGLYASPMTVGQNQQVTEAEIQGSAWYIEHRDTGDDLSEFGIETHRFRDAIYGRETYDDDQVVTSDTDRIPRHFGYTENATLGASYESEKYLVLTAAGRTFYESLYPDYREFWKYEQSDFDRLPRDPTVSSVYDNGEYDVYRVNATA